MTNYLIIGGSSAIGTKLIELLLNTGANVYASYNKSEISITSDRLTTFHLDVLTDSIPEGLLPDQLNGFAYLPGAIQLKPFKRIKAEVFREDYELQVVGAIKTLQTVLPKLTTVKGSSVLFYSTVAVQKGFNFHSVVASSKGAIEGLTKSLAAELAPTTRVNCIAPSLTRSPLAERFLNTEQKEQIQSDGHPMKRVGEPDDVASMSHFLLSNQSSWMTGQVLHVDGGRSTLD